MKKSILFIGIASLSLVSCGTEKSNGDKLPFKSFELTNKADTINLVDGNGKKQGLWLMPISKDTVVYRNDTAHSVTNMTSGEMIRLLKSGFTGPFVSYDSLVVNSH